MPFQTTHSNAWVCQTQQENGDVMGLKVSATTLELVCQTNLREVLPTKSITCICEPKMMRDGERCELVDVQNARLDNFRQEKK